MDDIRFQIVVAPEAAGPQPDALSYEMGGTGCPRDATSYDHHDEAGSPSSPGALTTLYEDMILGRPLPLVMVAREVADVDTVVAMALFSQRDLLLHPSLPGLVCGVDLVHRLGEVGQAHVDRDLCRLVRLIRGYVVGFKGSPGERGQRLTTAMSWIRAYLLDNTLPHVPPDPPVPHVVDVGTNGFVLAEVDSTPSREMWVELCRMGHLWGALVGPDVGGVRKYVVARRSTWLGVDFRRAVGVLCDMESAAGHTSPWALSGDLWIHGPVDGSILRPVDVLAVLVRI